MFTTEFVNHLLGSYWRRQLYGRLRVILPEKGRMTARVARGSARLPATAGQQQGEALHCFKGNGLFGFKGQDATAQEYLRRKATRCHKHRATHQDKGEGHPHWREEHQTKEGYPEGLSANGICPAGV